jgi:hypothetical protein
MQTERDGNGRWWSDRAPLRVGTIKTVAGIAGVMLAIMLGAYNAVSASAANTLRQATEQTARHAAEPRHHGAASTESVERLEAAMAAATRELAVVRQELAELSGLIRGEDRERARRGRGN